MARLANNFYDPYTGETYVWPINHETEEGFGRQRNITTEANTANIGLVRIQGAKQPMKLSLAGTILTRAQRDAFWDWFNRCETRTIYFTDIEGSTFEVIVTNFNPLRRAALVNRQDEANAPRWYWTYTMEMDVLRVVGGPLAGVVFP